MKTIMRFSLITVAAVALCCSGCSTGTTKKAGMNKSGKITVCMLPKKKGVPYFSSCANGAQKAAAELGNVEVIYDGPTDGSPEKAAAMIEKWTLKGVDVIAVSPNDPDVVSPAMKKAMQKGVRVITWDADTAPDARELFVNQATAEQIGSTLVDTLSKDIGPAGGKVAIITATLTAANQNEWMKYMKVRLKAYPKLNLIAVKPCNEDQKLAFQVAQDLMKANPDLKGIFAISSVAFPGAAEAIKQAGKSGQVNVTGLSTPNDMKPYVKDGTVKSVILWNTEDLGTLTVNVAQQLAQGKLKTSDSSIKAGKLGEKKIVDKNVLLGDILVFNKGNIDKFDF